MAATTADILTAPQAGWWPYTWPVPWHLICLSALVWALLRAREKSASSPPAEGNDKLREEEWEEAA
ncbi:hypothetical protein OEB94_02465 [Streptomyces sp. ICN988]|uniref:hypothetical protein n=1 Tax=Streptomyces sp. ICN988 TaxID=2983765 RepID=UPI0021E3AF02|nr:hypothetical protein [Streptomyces sp. ICN988]MCV2458155.1 hypothetical protein [Streptomyces sp. ICN988]